MTKLISDEIMNEIIRRIVETAHPRKIILFGSAARGEMGPNSDLDILVVMPTGIHRRKTARSIYRNLIGVGFAADIVVVTEQDLDRYGDNIGMVIKPAIEQGKILYNEIKSKTI
jgi:predicted nucleotidyltransferase